MSQEINMAGLLEGIRAVEYAAFGVGPIAGLVLASLGAEIVKIESPRGGDPTRGFDAMEAKKISPDGHTITFEFTNRHKKSVTIDLAKPKGKEIAYKIIESSDVFFSNYLPQSLSRLGFDYKNLSNINPKLVYAASSSYGKNGPDSDKRAIDGLIMARSGLMMVSGELGDAPTQIRGMIADTTAGTYLAWAIVGALYARERLGIGQEVDTSLFGPLIWAQQWNISQILLGKQGIYREERAKSLPSIGNNYRCKDGKWIKVCTSPGGGKECWPEFCQVLNIQQLEEDVRFVDPNERVANAEALVKILDGIFIEKTRDEWIEYLKAKKASFLYEGIQEVSELSNDPQVRLNQYIIEEDHPILGRIRSVKFPVNYSGTPLVSEMKPAPKLGEHTVEVLRRVGYSQEDISRFGEHGLV